MAGTITQVGTLDPRVRRTRLMLHDGLWSLLEKKEFDKISVQDIAEAAELNRATFYDHYSDKFALLECMVGSRFGELLERRGVRFSGCDGALRAIVLGVCDYITSVPGAACGGGRQLEGHMETAVIAVVRKMLLDGMKRHVRVEGEPAMAMSDAMVASAVSWAIYGACKEWLHTAGRCEAEEIVGKIEGLVVGMLRGTGS
ncbi:TetR/AcrR family transcriptional regulator [Granulicella tundricola]|nr:TetR/AcrR family transcriptional regulator [Granulicella tundricola]